LRPEVALGASDEDLSVPQHELNKDATAEQKQKPALVAIHVTTEAIVVALLRVFQMSVKKEMDTVDGPAKEGNSIQEVKWNCFLKSTVRGAVSLL
jgi:hypothetical protein